ncbi:hypothetical protein C8Q80DRAFT_1354618 [Daedaleopsis nitida]|nr:hypothetical protein C8Q80DRAFT_1354618 [Daedaleopsis nitida]
MSSEPSNLDTSTTAGEGPAPGPSASTPGAEKPLPAAPEAAEKTDNRVAQHVDPDLAPTTTTPAGSPHRSAPPATSTTTPGASSTPSESAQGAPRSEPNADTPEATTTGPSAAHTDPALLAQQAAKKRRQNGDVLFENEKSNRTDSRLWAPALSRVDVPTKPPPGARLRRAAERTAARVAKKLTGRPSGQTESVTAAKGGQPGPAAGPRPDQHAQQEQPNNAQPPQAKQPPQPHHRGPTVEAAPGASDRQRGQPRPAAGPQPSQPVPHEHINNPRPPQPVMQPLQPGHNVPLNYPPGHHVGYAPQEPYPQGAPYGVAPGFPPQPPYMAPPLQYMGQLQPHQQMQYAQVAPQAPAMHYDYHYNNGQWPGYEHPEPGPQPPAANMRLPQPPINAPQPSQAPQRALPTAAASAGKSGNVNPRQHVGERRPRASGSVHPYARAKGTISTKARVVKAVLKQKRKSKRTQSQSMELDHDVDEDAIMDAENSNSVYYEDDNDAYYSDDGVDGDDDEDYQEYDEEDFEALDENIDALVDNMGKAKMNESDEDAIDQDPEERFHGAGSDQLAFHMLDQINFMIMENRSQNKTMMSTLSMFAKRLSGFEKVQRTPVVLAQRPKRAQRVKASKPDRSKDARIVLPDPKDGEVRSPGDIERLQEIEKVYLNRAANVVRLHLRKLLQARSYEEIAAKCPPMTEDEFKDYMQAPKDKDYFTPKTFRIDFSQSWTKFPPNIDARDYLLRHLIQALKGGAYSHKEDLKFPSRYWTEYHLGAALDSHIDHCRSKIRRITDPRESDDPEREAQRARIRGRRKTLHEACVGVVVDRGYDEHMELMSLLQPVNYSDDETDAEEGRRRSRASRFRIIQCLWMSDDLRTFLRKLYDAHCDDYEMSPDSKGGRGPRERFVRDPPDAVVGTAATGLWSNCYNPQWLASLKRHELRKLNIRKGKYDFKIREYDEIQNEAGPEFVQGSSRGTPHCAESRTWFTRRLRTQTHSVEQSHSTSYLARLRAVTRVNATAQLPLPPHRPLLWSLSPRLKIRLFQPEVPHHAVIALVQDDETALFPTA